MTRPRFWSPAELLAIAFAHPRNFPPGTAYEYCNTNYALLGLMAEEIDGKLLASCFPGPFVRTAGTQGDDHANFVTLIYLLMRP
jgi:hypothetical protein